jgi:hypothetical protein
MPKLRKLWATSFPQIAGPKRRHESNRAVYRYVEAEVANWLCGALRSRHLTVWVDERDGHGWQVYERLDLDELGKAGEV